MYYDALYFLLLMLIKSTDPIQLLLAFPFIQTLDSYYPDISNWYVNNVVPNTVVGNDIVLLNFNNNTLTGIAVGKNGLNEKKLRCVRIHPDYQNSGLGLRLIEEMFQLLETDKPHCTVCEEMIHLYSRPFINRYGFMLNSVHKGLYRKNKLEYSFNDT